MRLEYILEEPDCVNCTVHTETAVGKRTQIAKAVLTLYICVMK